MPDHICTEPEFVRQIVPSLPRIMWFLGAGASRAAGLPTASDIIWDLKRRYCCLQENHDPQAHNVNNQVVRAKLQDYMDGRGFPAYGSPEEYAFYFALMFGDDHAAQQGYIADQLSSDKITLNIGNRALAALLAADLSRIVFTVNFDEVVERAYAFVTGKNLAAFHLEGAYAALDALNAEQFPLYAKLHGDFRFRSIKNLPDDLAKNDAEIQRCLLAASSRYGMLVAGYSGRDSNVMEIFEAAIDQVNAFPHGFFWTTPRLASVASPVQALISKAIRKGVKALIVETGTFDIMMTRVWRQLPQKPTSLDEKVYTAKAQPVAIPLPPPGQDFPVVRTNGLPITALPTRCGKLITQVPLKFEIINERRGEKRPDSVITFTDQALFWGSVDEVKELFRTERVMGVEEQQFEDVIASIASSGAIKAFFEEALVRALCHDKPLMIRRKDRTWFAVVDHNEVKNPLLRPILQAISSPSGSGLLSGPVPKVTGAFWGECVSIKLEERNQAVWLLIRPDVWITPMTLRDEAKTFLRERKLRRWNAQAYGLLDAWINLLLGSTGKAQEAQVSCLQSTDYPIAFMVNTRSAYSGQGGVSA